VQGNATTEDGGYTMEDAYPGNLIRNAGATIVLTSEDEWYKAAYYDAVAASYFDYPAGSNMQTTCTAPTAAANSANCNSVGFTDVGSYTGSSSPNGTFDQGGNVWEWNESIISDVSGGLRGGVFAASNSSLFAASFRDTFGLTSEVELDLLGFRVASLPEPAAGLLMLTGMLGLSIWRRRRA
jgi:formylglycine-generating enzyme required for sulfatase activity